MIDEFLTQSLCVKDNKQKEFLIKLLGNKKLVTFLLFRGSMHGWKNKDFITRCSEKGPTISLFKIKDGDCIGGFTKAQWNTASYFLGPKFYEDKDAFLFNLSSYRQFINKGKGGIVNSTIRSPAFNVNDKTEELTAFEPFNGDKRCESNGL